MAARYSLGIAVRCKDGVILGKANAVRPTEGITRLVMEDEGDNEISKDKNRFPRTLLGDKLGFIVTGNDFFSLRLCVFTMSTT